MARVNTKIGDVFSAKIDENNKKYFQYIVKLSPPESVKAFESSGVISTIKGRDGVTRQILKIPGEYGSKKGFFEFIKEANGTINHRFFRTNP